MKPRIQLLSQMSQNILNPMIGKVDKSGIYDRIMTTKINAEVAELADALRSGRSEHYARVGSNPTSGTISRRSRGFCYLVGLKPFGICGKIR